MVLSLPLPRDDAANARSLSDSVVAFIDRHYEAPISLRHVAAALGYSPAHLTHAFRVRTGMPVTAWIIRRRIAAAVERFSHTRDDVATTSEAVGFNDVSYFTRQFTRHVGIAPGRYRNAVRRPAHGDVR